jgi:hypothetical protein
MKDLKFNMHLMKVHDCHVIMTKLLPVAIRGVLQAALPDHKAVLILQHNLTQGYRSDYT